MITVTASSDIHGSWSQMSAPDEANVLAFAGDVTSDGRLQNGIAFLEWAKQFVPYFDDVVMVPGNHDKCFDAQRMVLINEASSRGIELLIDRAITARCGTVIHGTPWSVPYGRWNFMAPEDELAEKYKLIPDNVELLVSHGPPYQVRDRTARRVNAGSRSLLARIENLPELRAFVCGHIHEARGQQTIRQNCVAYNVACLDEDYNMQAKCWTTFAM